MTHTGKSVYTTQRCHSTMPLNDATQRCHSTMPLNDGTLWQDSTQRCHSTMPINDERGGGEGEEGEGPVRWLLLAQGASQSFYVQWRLSASLSNQDKPDLLSLLPPELQLTVLHYIDGPSLLSACKVSKEWREILLTHSSLWTKKCRELGVNMDISHVLEDPRWHNIYVQSLNQMTALKTDTAFSESFIYLQNCKTAVKAVDYQHGFLCTVSEEDYINIWQLEKNIPVMAFPVDRAVSCIKFHPHFLLVCGHFVGMLTSWDLSEMANLNCATYDFEQSAVDCPDLFLKNKFKMHSGPIFSCDFSQELNLLVSGGGDECIKLWCLSTGLVVRSLPNQNHWVLKVILMPDLSFSSQHTIICMTRDDVNKIRWSAAGDENSCTLSLIDRMGSIDELDIQVCIKLNAGKNNFFTPGLQHSSKFIGLIRQDIDEKNATLMIYNIYSFELVYEVSLQFKVKKLLALGNRYALLLTVGSILYSSTLIIVDIVTGKVIGSHTVPHSKMTTPDGAQLVVGDTQWLDGLTGDLVIQSSLGYDKLKQNKSAPCNLKNGYQIDGGIVNNYRNSRDSPLPLYSEPEMKHISIRSQGQLVLALGIQSEPGRLFTLWWSQPQQEPKCKEE
ncbi:unnamed protein product, partial [Meganyctiphanes norvegica]